MMILCDPGGHRVRLQFWDVAVAVLAVAPSRDVSVRRRLISVELVVVHNQRVENQNAHKTHTKKNTKSRSIKNGSILNH